jgi:hypothetical protein
VGHMSLYRVVHTTCLYGRFTDREFLASCSDAWDLWLWLTTMAKEAPQRRDQGVRDRQATILSASGPLPDVTVKVFDIDGHEVCPENGLSGMAEYRLARGSDSQTLGISGDPDSLKPKETT